MLRRVLLIALKPDISVSDQERFEATLSSLPEHVTGILEWRLARNLSSMRPGQAPYSHVWEVTFNQLSDLRRYQTNQFHSDAVHPMFDKSSPSCLVDTYVAVYYELES